MSAVGKTYTVSRAGVSLHFLKRLVAGDRHNLASAGAALGQPCGDRLTQTVRGAMREACLIAPRPELVSKAIGRERLAEGRHEARRLIGGDFREYRGEVTMNLNVNVDRRAVLVLSLGKASTPGPEVVLLA